MRTIKVSAVAFALASATLFMSPSAFAAGGTFRSFHGEPLNDLHVTPGATFHVNVATICRSGYSTSVRDVPESEKNQAYAEYGITHRTTGQYEIDHLIPLELGGSNVVSNLWPQLNDHPRGYLNSKDILENHLHELVCGGKLALARAQTLIASNWVSTYRQFLGVWPIAHAVPTVVAPTGTFSTVAPQGGLVRVTSLVAVIAPGSYESLLVHSSKANDSCTLRVTLPSGRVSTASGLGTAKASANGVVVWSWRIGSSTDPGTAHLSVECGAGRATATFVII